MKMFDALLGGYKSSEYLEMSLLIHTENTGGLEDAHDFSPTNVSDTHQHSSVVIPVTIATQRVLGHEG